MGHYTLTAMFSLKWDVYKNKTNLGLTAGNSQCTDHEVKPSILVSTWVSYFLYLLLSLFPKRTEIDENSTHEEIKGTLNSGNALLSVSSEKVTCTKFTSKITRLHTLYLGHLLDVLFRKLNSTASNIQNILPFMTNVFLAQDRLGEFVRIYI
jgi:hypothetical protein